MPTTEQPKARKRRPYPQIKPERFLVRYPQLEGYGITWSRVWIDKLIERGKFPRKVYLGRDTMGWWSDEIEAFLEARSAEREEPQTAA
jgi:predicted DNA-binding transcriptional regulator AlpA